MESLKVLTQMNETAGALSIPLALKYPVAAAMTQPTKSPIITLVDFMIGDPNLSQSRIVTKTENPRPEVLLADCCTYGLNTAYRYIQHFPKVEHVEL